MRKKLTAWKIREVPVIVLIALSAAVLWVFYVSLSSKSSEEEVDAVMNSVIALAVTIPAIILPIQPSAKNSLEAKKSLKNIIYWILGFCTILIIKFLLDVLKTAHFYPQFTFPMSVFVAACSIICYLFIIAFSVGYVHKYLQGNLNLPDDEDGTKKTS